MGWVVEQAGGKASTGTGAMLDQEVSPLRWSVFYGVKCTVGSGKTPLSVVCCK